MSAAQIRDRNTGDVIIGDGYNPPLVHGQAYVVSRQNTAYAFVSGDVYIAFQEPGERHWKLLNPSTGVACFAGGYQNNKVGFRRLRDNEELVITNSDD